MAINKTFPWENGEGALIAVYDGIGNGALTFSSVPNNGIDRSFELKVTTSDGTKEVCVTVTQEGRREIFRVADGDFILSDGETFNVLKNNEQ